MGKLYLYLFTRPVKVFFFFLIYQSVPGCKRRGGFVRCVWSHTHNGPARSWMAFTPRNWQVEEIKKIHIKLKNGTFNTTFTICVGSTIWTLSITITILSYGKVYYNHKPNKWTMPITNIIMSFGSAVGWDTALQAESSMVRFPIM